MQRAARHGVPAVGRLRRLSTHDPEDAAHGLANFCQFGAQVAVQFRMLGSLASFPLLGQGIVLEFDQSRHDKRDRRL